jgi:hypothetical protein
LEALDGISIFFSAFFVGVGELELVLGLGIAWFFGARRNKSWVFFDVEIDDFLLFYRPNFFRFSAPFLLFWLGRIYYFDVFI